MPSKAHLMNLKSTGACVAYAAQHLGLSPIIHHIKILEDGQIEVCLCEPGGANERTGIGETKLEAVAECISVNFPVNAYPDL